MKIAKGFMKCDAVQPGFIEMLCPFRRDSDIGSSL